MDSKKGKVAKSKITSKEVEKRRAANRERQRKFKQKIKEDEQKYAEFKKAEKERSKRRREEGKIPLIKDLNDREKRKQRAEWKKRNQRRSEKKKKNDETIALTNALSPPQSPAMSDIVHDEQFEERVNPIENDNANEVVYEPPNIQTNQNIKIKSSRNTQKDEEDKKKKESRRKKMLRKCRDKYKNKIKILEKQLKRQEKLINKWKQKHARLSKKHTKNDSPNTSNIVSPNSKVSLSMGDKDLVRKKLIVAEILNDCLSASSLGVTPLMPSPASDSSSTKLRKVESYIKKYKVGTEMRSILGWRKKRKLFGDFLETKTNSGKKEKWSQLKKVVTRFFEDDDNSFNTPGKRDTLTKKKCKKQKRYLSDSLFNLHKKFILGNNTKISYSLFCRWKPFWVVHRPINARDTCLCKNHENFNLLFQKCKQYKMLAFKNVREMIDSTVCDTNKYSCMYRECDECKSSSVKFVDDSSTPPSDSVVHYYEWKVVKEEREKRGEKVDVKVTKKCKEYCTLNELKQKLLAAMKPFMNHTYRVFHQSLFSKELRSDKLEEDEVFVIIDFSENYQFKYSNEVQSRHFGASNEQLTLHTGGYFLKNQNNEEVEGSKSKIKTFCTVSTCNRHDASAIWAHLQPVIRQIKEENKHIKNVHILSDGPTKQYRNKSNLHLFCYFLNHHRFDKGSYNFSESGHGKSIADGVGGVIKRTADAAVKNGSDVSNIDEFLTAVKYLKTEVFVITENQICDVDNILKDKVIEAVPNTMKLHQVTWSTCSKMIINCRFLSCTSCRNLPNCNHFGNKTSKQHDLSQRLPKAKEHHNNFKRKPICDTPLQEMQRAMTSCSDGNAPSDDESLYQFSQHSASKKSRLLISDVYSEDEDSSSEENVTGTQDIVTGDFVLVKLSSAKTIKHYTAKVIHIDDDGDYEVSYLRKSAGIEKFVFPNVEDIASVTKQDIVQVLKTPVERRGAYTFDNELHKFPNMS